MTQRSICLIFGVIAACGCAASHWPESEHAAHRSLGVASGIELKLQGEPDDAASLADGLSMEMVIREMLAHDPEIQMALARVRGAQAEAHQARLLPNPVLSVVLKWPDGGGSPTVEAGVAAELLALLRKPGQIKVADGRLRATSAEAVATVLEVVAEAQRRYAEVQALDAVMEVLEERRVLVERLREVVCARVDVGESAPLDATVMESQRLELEVEIAERKLERRRARLALARLIGRPSSEAEWAVEPWKATADVDEHEGTWITAALVHRPEIQAQVWELESLGAERRQASWLVFEGIEIGAEAEREEGMWSVGPALSAPLPVFDWGQAGVARAQARWLEAAHGLTDVRRRVIEEVRRAHAGYQMHRLALAKAREQWLPLLERRHEQAEAAYRVGENDLASVLLAEQELRAGKTRLIDLERQAAEALIELRRAVGGAGMAPESNVALINNEHVEESP